MADALDPEAISGPRKAAIFVMARGEEYATKVFETGGKDYLDSGLDPDTTYFK